MKGRGGGGGEGGREGKGRGRKENKKKSFPFTFEVNNLSVREDEFERRRSYYGMGDEEESGVKSWMERFDQGILDHLDRGRKEWWDGKRKRKRKRRKRRKIWCRVMQHFLGE